MQAAHRAPFGVGDAFDGQVAVGQVALDVRLEAVLLEEAEVVFELLFFLFVLQRVIQQPGDAVTDQPGRMVVQQGVLVVGIADQVHEHPPQSIATVKVHVGGLRERLGCSLEQQDEVFATLRAGHVERFAAVHQEHFVRGQHAALLGDTSMARCGPLSIQLPSACAWLSMSSIRR